MTAETAEPSVLIRNPLKLLYWLLFCRPLLRHYIQSIHENLDEKLHIWEIWGEADTDPRLRALRWSRWGLFASAPLAGMLLVGSVCSLLAGTLNWPVALLVITGYTLGLLLSDMLAWRFPKTAGWLVPVSGMLLFIIALAIAYVLFDTPNTAIYIVISTTTLAIGIAIGMGSGVVFGAISNIVFGVAVSLAVGLVFGIQSRDAIVMTFTALIIIAIAMAIDPALISILWRLPISYFRERASCKQLSLQAKRQPEEAAWLWKKQPLHYGSTFQLPLPGLDEHLAAIAKIDPEACKEALADVRASSHQHWAIPRALSLIIDHELSRCETLERLQDFHRETAWIPRNFVAVDEQSLFAEFSSISTDTVGAIAGATRETRENGLQRQIDRLINLKLQHHHPANVQGYASQWQLQLEEQVTRLNQERINLGELPSPYCAGIVLEDGDDAFQGREDLFRELENLLINPRRKGTALLLGQPRMGKSSALKQLPRRLGTQVLSVYIDMESLSTAANEVSLIRGLVREIRRVAQNRLQPITLPPLDDGQLDADAYQVFEQWIETIETQLGERRWLLLSLDEFNKIDEVLQSGRIDSRIFSMLRSLSQHHSRVALAVCGTFALSECDARWSEALKSAQTIPVSCLQDDEARQVLTRPSSDFPDDVYHEKAIDRALYLTGGHPSLLHILGTIVIKTYNRQREAPRTDVTPTRPLPVEAINHAVPEILESGTPFLVNIWEWSLRIGQAANQDAAVSLLEALAHQHPIDDIGDPVQNAELLALFCERDLLVEGRDNTYRFRVPLIAEWIKNQRRLPRI